MVGITVKKLAEQLKIKEDLLLQNINNAGLPQTNSKDEITNEHKKKLLSWMVNTTNKKTSFNRPSSDASIGTKLVSSTVMHGAGNTSGIKVEIKKDRTHIKKIIEQQKAIIEENKKKELKAKAKQKELEKEQNAKKKEKAIVEQPNIDIDKTESVEKVKKTQKETLIKEKTKTIKKEAVQTKNTDKSIEKNHKKDDEKKEKASKAIDKDSSDEFNKKMKEDLKEPLLIKEIAKPKKSVKKKSNSSAKDKNWQSLVNEEGLEENINQNTENISDEDSIDSYVPVIKNVTSTAEIAKIVDKPLAFIKNKHAFKVPSNSSKLKIELIPPSISVVDLAAKINIKAGVLIKHLMKIGVMANINQDIDIETAELFVHELGHEVEIIDKTKLEDKIFSDDDDTDSKTIVRPPIVTIMGHVDHGKTSLLDYIRKTKVADKEHGGITQHIGAYHIELNNNTITFIDTPGHAAFTNMRARGAQVTDIVILIVAADDGVMPQTKEAIVHAKDANVPIIVAITKFDKEGVKNNLEQIKNDLATLEIIPEDWGGDSPVIPVSSKTGLGISELLESILLQAEIRELKASYSQKPRGVILESSMNKSLGCIATAIVTNGVLEKGNTLLVGKKIVKVRLLLDENNKPIKKAGPSMPVRILGFEELANAGDKFILITNEKEVNEYILHSAQSEDFNNNINLGSIDKEKALELIKGTDAPSVLNVIVKADVKGTLEAIINSVQNIKHDEVMVKVISSGIGAITESDVMLTSVSNATLIGFNVRADKIAKGIAENRNIDMRYYSVIYNLIDDIKTQLSGLLKPQYQEKILGIAEVREVFNSPKFGQIAGSIVTEGSVFRNKNIRVLRDNKVIFEGELESLRRFKDDVKEVRNGLECGIGVKNYTDVLPGDQIEVFDNIEVKRSI